jgi:serine/threonine-protein kinase HipA
MPSCRICLGPLKGEALHHLQCLERLFGVETLPALEIRPERLLQLASEMAGKMSISGAQEKVSLRLSDDRSRLEPAVTGGRYILKPEPARFAHVPENEHLTMCMAALAGIEVPPCGLVEMEDGSWAYVIKRFDRLKDGAKLRVEDFCQLDERPARDKYQGSGELCVRILRKYASEPLIEIRKLFKLLLFSWWVSNGDQHLKNFSLVIEDDDHRRLSPAYDLINTRLPIPSDEHLALSIGGKRNNLNRQAWMDFASYCRIPAKAAVRLIHEQVESLDGASRVIARCFLPEDLKETYERIIRENTALLID